MPTLVIQGKLDPMQSWRAGKATADAIPGSRFLLYPEVGHDLPRAIWPAVLDEITALAEHLDVMDHSRQRQRQRQRQQSGDQR